MSASMLRRVVYRKICTAASALVGRPSLKLPPSFAAVEDGIRKVEYKFYSPLEKDDIVRFNNSGGEEEVDLMKNKCTNWVGSSHGWLALFNLSNCDMCLLNPLSGRRIHLPPFPSSDKEVHRYPFKVILSHSPLEDECRAVMILGSRDRAVFCSPGRCQRWSPLGGRWYQLPRSDRFYNDLVYSASRKTFLSAMRVRYGSDSDDDLEFWDASSTTMEAPVDTVRASHYWHTLPDPGHIWQTYLVSEEESGQLFMVRRYLIDNKRVDYNVFRIISTNGNGRAVVARLCESLDGLVMFIGMNHCFAVKASRFPEYKPNRIYFSGVWFHQNQLADIYDYHTKAYSHLIDFLPHQKFPYGSTLPWFTLTKD